MSIRPDYISIGDLFGRNYVFRVPRYQRGYAWEDPEIDDFLSDITACYNARIDGQTREHFFGGVVAVSHEVTGSAGHHCDLIDGQQRIATFVVLASCLERLFRGIADDANAPKDKDSRDLALSRADQIRATYLTFQDEINRKPVEISRLELSHPDQAFFSDLVSRDATPSGPADDSRQSHVRLWNAYERVFQDLTETIEEYDTFQDQLYALGVVRDILLHDATVINIVTDEEAEGYRLFQVLNDRGTKLSEGDLLRASTLELLGTSAFAEQHDRAARLWDKILKEDPGYTNKFLRWYFASCQGYRPGQSSLFEDFLDEFFPEKHHTTIRVNDARRVVRTIEHIELANRQCRQMLSGQWPFDGSRLSRWDRTRLSLLTDTLDHSLCTPLLLAACCLDERKFCQIVQLTERFAFRTKLICNVHTTSLQKVYHAHSLQIRDNPDTYRVVQLESDYQRLLQDKASEKVFEASLCERLTFQQSSGNSLIKYFLSTIDDYWRWYQDGAQGRPKCRDVARVMDLAELTVEHVYPQKPTASTRDPACDVLVNTLGNLTILGRDDNQAAGNKSFATKKPYLKSSSIRINNVIGQQSKWRKTEIEKRRRELIAVAKAIFR